MTKTRMGFSRVFLILIVVAVIGVIIAFALVLNKDSDDSLVNKISDSLSGEPSDAWLKGCQSEDRVNMTHLPMDIESMDTVSPLGLIAGAHVTPIDHLYIYPKESERDKYPVYAMADGYIVDISSRGVMVDTGDPRPPEYRLVFQHSCQTVSYFDLVTKLDDSILKETGALGPNESKTGLRIPVKGGKEIGRIGAQSLDTAIYNFSMTLPGFINPEMYEVEFWKVHTDDFFSYFSKEHQDSMQALNRRKVEPFSGKIDYDIPGKLIGNWFKEGTNGYAGAGGFQNQAGGEGYWVGHLAIFYDAILTETVIVSFGSYNGEPKAFAVKNNAPDPADIGAQDGVIKYELTNAPNSFFPHQETQTFVQGTVLFQVLPGEKLKMEIFPGKSSAEVDGFTSAALMYER